MSRMLDQLSALQGTRALQFRGYALVMVLVILAIVSVLGVAGLQISLQSARGARNDGDFQLAWQAAEAAILDAEVEIRGTGESSRRAVFSTPPDLDAFVDGCGSSGKNLGLCKESVSGRPAWLLVDFSKEGADARTVRVGQFTGRKQSSILDLRGMKSARYVVELLKDPDDPNGSTCIDDCLYLYRVTAMGFGSRPDVQAVLQMVYRN